MSFSQRPKSNIQTLDQKVTVSEKSGAFEIMFDVGGHDRVPVTIELTFRRGGKLEGVEPDTTRLNTYFLRHGMGRYIVENDVITFGPGQADHEMIRMGEANCEAYGGTTQQESYRIYITGFTPFRKTLTIA